jgi:hypothetical protein
MSTTINSALVAIESAKPDVIAQAAITYAQIANGGSDGDKTNARQARPMNPKMADWQGFEGHNYLVEVYMKCLWTL